VCGSLGVIRGGPRGGVTKRQQGARAKEKKKTNKKPDTMHGKAKQTAQHQAGEQGGEKLRPPKRGGTRNAVGGAQIDRSTQKRKSTP